MAISFDNGREYSVAVQQLHMVWKSVREDEYVSGFLFKMAMVLISDVKDEFVGVVLRTAQLNYFYQYITGRELAHIPGM